MRSLCLRVRSLAQWMPWFGLVLAVVCLSSPAIAQIPAVKTCASTGIGAVKLTADAPVTIISVSIGSAGTGASAVPSCLVKVHVLRDRRLAVSQARLFEVERSSGLIFIWRL